MVDRVMGQLSLADALAATPDGIFDQIDKVIVWKPIRDMLGPRSADGPGGASYPGEPLLRALLLGVWNGLSDPGLEVQLRDRLSFRRFCRYSLADQTPDHCTLWRFRDELRRDGVLERLLCEINRQFEQKGLILKQGTLVDATFLKAAAKPPKKPKSAKTSKSAAPAAAAAQSQDSAPAADGGTPASQAQPACPDPDARWGRKGRQSCFGYKMHIGVDAGHGLIRHVVVTNASVTDTEPADLLMSGDEKAVYGDQAYHTIARHDRLQAAGIKDRMMHRPNKHHALTPRQKKRNQMIGRVRAAVERPFSVLKDRYHMRRLRFYNLAANQTHCFLAAVAYNLRRAAAVLLAPPAPA